MNEYKPWDEMGIPEVEYWKLKYLEARRELAEGGCMKRIRTITVAEIKPGDCIETVSGVVLNNVRIERDAYDATQFVIREKHTGSSVALGASIGVYLLG